MVVNLDYFFFICIWIYDYKKRVHKLLIFSKIRKHLKLSCLMTQSYKIYLVVEEIKRKKEKERGHGFAEKKELFYYSFENLNI